VIQKQNPVNAVGNKTPMHAALNILSRRQVSTGQMRFMLSRKGYALDDIQSCIEKLEGWGYLNDMVLARNILGAMIRNAPCGKKRCFYELRKRRFDRDLAETLIQEAYSEFDERDLAHAAAKQYAKNKTKWTLKDRERLARWLFRRGFTEATILSVAKTFGRVGDYE